MYGSVFLAIGSLCVDLRESQTLMLPAMVLSSMPLLLLPLVLAEPHSVLVTALSLVPFFTPVLMMIRATLVPSAPVWQVFLGALLSSGTALLCVAFAGRCLKAGLLSRGPAPKFRELLVWLRQS
jgi:ABC-2 type transport system permease protein